MAEAGVAFLLENLSLLALYKVKLYMSAKNEFKLLEDELIRMKAILEDAYRIPRKEGQYFKAWEGRVREVIYDAEDTMDLWFTEGNNLIKSLAADSIGKQVQDLRKNKVIPVLEEAKTVLEQMPKSEMLGRGVDDVRERLNKEPRSVNVVGFEHEIKTLVENLCERAEKLDVISIIGMAGLGKTTVARKIYDHPNIEYEFPIRIWIYVSHNFNKKEILIRIMEKFKPTKNLRIKSENELSLMVKNELDTQRFLLVMDDVWTVETWNQIEGFLPMNNDKGKVLITSRDVKVGQRANDQRIPYPLRFLTDKESLRLLQIEAFRKPNGFPEALKTRCTLIANQCGRLPLSIIVIGGVLASKRPAGQTDDVTEAEWQKVSDSVKTYLNDGDAEKQIRNFISLSYTTLPYHLRDCFLYMGIFPEDAEIPAWKLGQMWIAVGLVLQKDAKSLEEAAHDNLKELVDRNLVQVGTLKPNGKVKTCRLHDTIREFCKHEAEVENQNLFQEISKSKDGGFQLSSHIVQKSRGLCILSNVGEILNKYFPKKKDSKARVLLCFSQESLTLVGKLIPTITNASDKLRILEMSPNINFGEFPDKVSQLVHLRYISLSADEFKIIPDDISKLRNLQTILVVVTSNSTLEVKANLWKMVQLRHFITKASVTLKIGKGKGGETLQTLGMLSPESCTDDVFEKAKNLNTLGIRGDINKVDFSAKGFVSLEKLEKLKLYHDLRLKSVEDNPWRSFPLVKRFPIHLKSLTLQKTYLEWINMSFLGNFHTLEVLKLTEKAFHGNHWRQAEIASFSHLKFLHIEQHPGLIVWEAAPGSFPELRSLVIKNCEKLTAVPPLVHDKLNRMYLERVNTSVSTSARMLEAKKNEGSRIPVFKLEIRSV